MSAPIRSDAETPTMFPTMYAPPWAREEAQDLPAAAPLEAADGKRRWRDKPFDGDIAARHLRERPSLDPVIVPMPPMPPMPTVGILARVFGAVGLAALAAFFMVGTAPLSLAVKADGEAAPASFWSRFAAQSGNPRQAPQEFKLASAEGSVPGAFAERFATTGPAPEPPAQMPIPAQVVKTVAISPVVEELPPAPEPTLRALDRDEIAMLVKRSEELIVQGDIAGARLMLTRAAEAGDARAALVLGSTYESAVLLELGVLGVAPDARQAREWYAKAADFGSGEAKRRLEQFAESVR